MWRNPKPNKFGKGGHMTDNLRIERQYKQVLLKNMDSEICDLKGSIERTESLLDSLKYVLQITQNRRFMLKVEMYSHVDEQGKSGDSETVHANAA
jgi:hypothetical protein